MSLGRMLAAITVMALSGPGPASAHATGASHHAAITFAAETLGRFRISNLAFDPAAHTMTCAIRDTAAGAENVELYVSLFTAGQDDVPASVVFSNPIIPDGRGDYSCAVTDVGDINDVTLTNLDHLNIKIVYSPDHPTVVTPRPPPNVTATQSGASWSIPDIANFPFALSHLGVNTDTNQLTCTIVDTTRQAENIGLYFSFYGPDPTKPLATVFENPIIDGNQNVIACGVRDASKLNANILNGLQQVGVTIQYTPLVRTTLDGGPFRPQ